MRVYPSCPSINGPTTSRLSILDHSAARFGLTHAIFIYHASIIDTAEFEKLLTWSLRQTLDYYPHLSGQLSWAPLENGKGGRSQVTFGGGHKNGEPGLGWEVSRVWENVSTFLPGDHEKKEKVQRARVVEESVRELEPKGQVALWNLKTTHDGYGRGFPGIRIRLSLLEDGYAIAVKMAHVLGDAATLTSFIQRWAYFTTGLQLGDIPQFNPMLIDMCAEKAVCDTRSDEDRLADGRKLPCHRYDWHALDVPGYLPFLKDTSMNSIALAPNSDERRDDLTAPSWETWDIMRPVDHLQLHFSAHELQVLQADCSRALGGYEKTISKLDALLSHVWTLINRARYPDDPVEFTEVYLNCSLNARHRLPVPVPETFVGSTIFIAHVASPLSTFIKPGIDPAIATARSALKVRSMLEEFTPRAVSDLLFSMDAEGVPQRVWQAFCGTRHTLVTSWLRLGIRDVDFGHGVPADVRAVIPEMDGCVQVMEAAGGDGWNVEIYIEKEAGARFRSYAQ